MLRIGMIGKVLIHNYPYAAYFNGADDERLEALCTKTWMLPFVKGRYPQPATEVGRITCVWAGVREEAEAIAGSCRIERVCDTADEALESVDAALVLDEDAEFRTRMIERCIDAGKPVFADKVLALSAAKANELIAKARERGVAIAAWSQLLFAPEAEALRGAQGGAGLVTVHMKKDIINKYGVHLVCGAFGAFGCEPTRVARPDFGPDAAPAVLMTYADGKTVLARAGEDVPGTAQIAYLAKGCDPVVVRLADTGAMFHRSAEAIARMLETGEQPVSSEGLSRIAEACAILSG